MGCPVLDAAPALAVACALPAACPLVDLALLMVCPFVARALPVVCPFAAAARAPEAAFPALAVTRAPEAAFPAVAAFLALAAAPALKAACPALAAALAKLAIGRAQMEVRLNDGLGQTSTRRIRDIIIYMCRDPPTRSHRVASKKGRVPCAGTGVRRLTTQTKVAYPLSSLRGDGLPNSAGVGCLTEPDRA